MSDDAMPILSRFTRADAFADGVLIDACTTDLAAVTREHTRQLTPQVSVAITASLDQLLDETATRCGTDRTGMWHDILSLGGLAIGGRITGGLAYAVHRAVQDAAPTRRRVTVALGDRNVIVIVSIHEGDAGEPVVTVMLPSDD